MNSNYCVCCGKEIPEGRMVCASCEKEDALNLKKRKQDEDPAAYEPMRYRRKQKYGRKK